MAYPVKANSMSAKVEFKTRRIAEKFYWDLPDSAKGMCMGCTVMVDQERNRRIMQRVDRLLTKYAWDIENLTKNYYVVRRG